MTTQDTSVSLSSDGTIVAIGAPYNGWRWILFRACACL